MADTITNITISNNEWVDIYGQANIAIGTQIEVMNVGVCDVYLATQASQPEPGHNAYAIGRREGPSMINDDGDAGAWAFCPNGNGKINVRVFE